MIYIITLLLSLSIAKQYKVGHGNGTNFVIHNNWFAAAFPVLFITLLRYDVGTDYMQYLYGYYYNGIGAKRDKELVFQALIDFSHYLDFPFLMIVLFGTCICLFSYYLIFQKSLNVRQSILLFFLSGFFFMSLSMMRQFAATSLSFLSMLFLFKRKLIPYFIVTIFCSFLHSTGAVYVVVGLAAFFLYHWRNSIDLLKPSILVAFALLAFLLGSVMREYLMKLTEETQTYSGYFGSYQDGQNSSGTFLIFGITPFLSYLFANFFPHKRRECLEKHRMEYIVYTIMCFLSLVTGILRPLIPNGERIVFLFEPISIFSVPFFVFYTAPRYKKISLYGTYLLFGVCVVWYYYINRSLAVLPYRFIFSSDIDFM